MMASNTRQSRLDRMPGLKVRPQAQRLGRFNDFAEGFLCRQMC